MLTCESAALIKALIGHLHISCVFTLVVMTNSHGSLPLLNCLPNSFLGPSDGFWKYVCEIIRGWRHYLPQAHRPKDPGWWKGGLWCKYTRLSRSAKQEKLYNDRVALLAPTGHPEETSEQGSDRAAGPDRCSLRVQKEGGGGTDRPKGQDRESPWPIKANSPKARQFF